jgi:hypothetical protein
LDFGLDFNQVRFHVFNLPERLGCARYFVNYLFSSQKP